MNFKNMQKNIVLLIVCLINIFNPAPRYMNL